MNSVIVVGSLNIDQVVRTPRHPKIGETILGDDFRTFFGGKGANQAVAASRCGTAVTMVGKVGSDAFGDAILENLKNEGISLPFVRRDAQAPTGVAFIIVDDDGQNTIVVAPGANACVTPQDVQDAQPVFTESDLVVMQLEIPQPAVETALALAYDSGIRTILNAAPAAELPLSFYKQIDTLIVNQSELALLSCESTLDAGIKQLVSRGAKNILVTLGGEGVLIHEPTSETLLPAYRLKVVDTVGAGDAFVGAFSSAIAQGATTLEAAEWGNAAGALAVTRPGAQNSLPYGEEIELLRRAGGLENRRSLA
jgi:ribokinase